MYKRQLYALYKDNDLRKSYFVKYSESGGYVEYVKGGAVADFSRTSLSANFLFRTAEAYLNLAEATAYQGKEDDARKALNDLRVKRLATGQYTNSEESGADLIELIREERERELCLEGHRWFDLTRMCTPQEFVSIIKAAKPESTPKEYHVKFPIPQREIDLSQNMITQNEGYGQ